MFNILIVDDDEEMCCEMKEIIMSNNYQVEDVNDGLAGLEKAMTGKYDLVLLDLKMLGMTGREVLKELKTKKPDVKVLVLTGSQVDPKITGEASDEIEDSPVLNHNLKDEELLMADAVINKPFDIDEVLSKIRIILEQAK